MGKWLLAGCVVLVVSACGKAPGHEPSAETLPAGETLRLSLTEMPEMKAVGAEIATRDQAEALVRIPGTLVSLSVRAGDVVKKGQRIGMVVDSRLSHETSAYAAQHAAAEAEATRAKAELARIQDLHAHGVYAKARLDQAVAAARAAEAQVAAARAQQSAVSSVSAQGAIVAPSDGRVLRADIPAGSVVAPGMSVATITAGPPILRLMLPESVAGQVYPGSAVVVHEDNLPDETREGRVVQVYPAVTGGQVRVDAALPGLSNQLVGKRVKASVEVGRRMALVVPRHFVRARYGMDQVQLLTDGKKLSMVPVQIAPAADSNGVEILSGVSAGDTLFAPKAAEKAARP